MGVLDSSYIKALGVKSAGLKKIVAISNRSDLDNFRNSCDVFQFNARLGHGSIRWCKRGRRQYLFKTTVQGAEKNISLKMCTKNITRRSFKVRPCEFMIDKHFKSCLGI